MRNEYSVFVEASKRKFILAAVEDMKRRTANAAKGLKNFDLTHKITRRKEAEVKLKSLKKFIPDLDVPAVTQQYLALITSLGNSPENSSIISKLQFAIRTGGYENIIPVFQLALSSIDNACCEQGFSTMNDIKTSKRNKLNKPLFPLMLLGMHGRTFNFDCADLGVKIASTWTYD